LALSGSSDTTLKLWEVATGREVRTFKGHTNRVRSVAYSPDGRWALSGGPDGSILWDINQGTQLAVLLSFIDGTWAVMSPDGRYDSSNEGVIEGLHWVEGMSVIPLKRENREGYTPGLLAKVLGSVQ
jgi:WD40 repeat protein